MAKDIFNFYAVALIDMLGQSIELERFTVLPKDETENKEFLIVARATVGRVRRFRKSIRQFNQLLSRPISVPATVQANWPPEAYQLFKKYRQPEIRIGFFSDLAIISVSLLDNPYHSPLFSIHGLLHELSLLLLTQMASGVMIRGAIDVGICSEIEKGELYGQGLSRAYSLEAERADYPRIVLGPHFLQYLESYSRSDVSPPEKVIQESYLNLIGQCIELDQGSYILSYLCELIKHSYSEEPHAFEEVVKHCCRFIKGEIERCGRNDDQKLGRRAYKVKEYFQTHKCWIETNEVGDSPVTEK
ncbi:MAG: hypothetical protein ABSC55_27430 [Syntrophorhabdales bacterium]|jgi:hypothetical protein